MTLTDYNKSVDDFADRLYRFVLKTLHGEDDAKDVVQETFARLWSKLEEVSPEKVKSYLFTTAYHIMIDMFRKEKRRSEYQQKFSDETGHSVSYSDLSEILHEALKKLPEIQRSVILLRDYEGYSYDEIAEITKLNESQVKVYIFRGRMFLKKYIGSIETVV
ncbi:MAG: RNA polymerase sigma factor [Bacteroidales bacterium]|nr:RNA polymerase sigma factor [Bacteroidales bacterium]